MKKWMIVLIGAVLLVTLGCNLTVQLPDVPRMQTVPTITEQISVPVPQSASPTNLQLDFGAGKLTLNPGAGSDLVSGVAKYNVPDIKPVILENETGVQIKQGELEFTGFPNFDNFENEWDLQLADTLIDLRINAGAYQGFFELGGLSLTSLQVTDGAADVDLSFSEANKVPMESLRYETGASQVKLAGLANCNCSEIIFRAGAGDYTLDFSGELQQDTTVSIKSGFSNLDIIVPMGVNTQVSFETAVATIDAAGDWRQSGERYSLTGDGPTLTLTIDMVGNINLRNR